MAFPTVQTTSSGTLASGTSHSISSLPSSISPGDLLVAVISMDGNPTLSTVSSGWVKLDQASNSTSVTGAIFYKFATGSNALTVTSSATEEGSYIVYRITDFDLTHPIIGWDSANGSSADSNPATANAYIYREIDDFGDASLSADWTAEVPANVSESGGNVTITKTASVGTYHGIVRDGAEIGIDDYAVFRIDSFGGSPSAGGHEAGFSLIGNEDVSEVYVVNVPGDDFVEARGDLTGGTTGSLEATPVWIAIGVLSTGVFDVRSSPDGRNFESICSGTYSGTSITFKAYAWVGDFTPLAASFTMVLSDYGKMKAWDRDILWIATRHGDAAVVATVAPSGFSSLLTQAGTAGGASTNAATRQQNADFQNPAAFTSATEQWVCYTIGISPSLQKKVRVRVGGAWVQADRWVRSSGSWIPVFIDV